MAGIKFENLITLENTSNLGNAIVSKSQDISDKIKNKFTKSNQDIIETDIRIEPHTIIETDEAEKIISNATDDITEDLQSKINVIKKYFSDKANVKTNNSKGRRNAEWHASENLKNDPNGSQELLDFVRGYENVDEAVNAFVEHQKNRIKEVTVNAQQAADSINTLTNTIDNTNINDLQDINVDNGDSNPNEANDSIEQLVENLEEVSNASLEAEESGDELSEAIQNGMEEGSDAIQETGNNVDDLSKRTEQAATGFKSLGTIASSILKNIAIAAVVTLISMAISALVEDINAWVHATENAQKDLENTAKEYEDLTSQLDDVNSKLDENAEKIAEINKNPLAITASDDLKNLREQNAQLEYQKQILETTTKLKAKALERDTINVLNGKYKYDPENGIEASATGKDYLTRANELFDSYSTNYKEIKNAELTSPEDIKNYQIINNEMIEQQSHLADVVDYLNVQKDYLNENSNIYKEVNQIIDNIINKEKEIEESKGLNNFAQNLISELENTYDDFDIAYSNFQLNIETAKKGVEEGSNNLFNNQIQVNGEALDVEVINDELEKILSNNGIELIKNNQFSSTLYGNSVDEIINALKQINQLKQQGIEFDTEAEKLIISQLYNWALLEDNAETNAVLNFESQIQAYNYFKQYLEDNSIDLTSIGADTYLSFIDGFISEAEKDGNDTNIIEQFLASFFPDFQTIEGRMYAYIKNNPVSELSKVVNDYSNGKGLPIEYTDQLIEVFGNLGTSADGAAGYIHKLSNEITNEEIAALKSATNQAQQEFVNNQTDFNDNFSNTKDTFVNAISNISSGSTISYEDMWTLINADSELATKFKKSANGYTISIEELTKAQEKYSEETKNTYLKAIEDAQKRIDEAQSKKKALGQKLSRTRNGYDAKIISEQIKECNDEIQINTELIAKNQLMYEQASDSLLNYAQKLEDVVNKLSTFKSLYESIVKDMSKIGRIGAESMVELINAFPDNWQNLIKKSDNGNGYQLDTEAYNQVYTQTIVQNLGLSGTDEVTIANDLEGEIGSSLQSLADKYGIVYDKGKSLAEQFKEIRTKAGQAAITSKDFYNELNDLETGFKDTDTVASMLAKVIQGLIDSLEESEALADFNKKVSELQHQLNMGLINQAQYDAGYAAASTKFENAANDENEGVSDPATQEQIWSNQEQIYSAQQSQYQKDLDKKTQDLQDAYDHRLISAKEYYRELNKLEDEYYGTETTKGLLNDPDGTNVENKNRQQLERRATLVNDEIEQIKKDYSRGLMTFEEFERSLGNSLDYWLGNIEELKDTYNELERENISALYEEEVSLANNQLEQGKISNFEYAKDMLRIWEKYYKDKNSFRQEDLEAERQVVNASKEAVQSQIDAFQHLIDKNNDDAERQIENLEKQKEKIEEKYDKQIEDLEKQKKLIEDATDEEDRRLKILEARQALEKAWGKTRAVFNSDGTLTYKPDTDKVKEAEKNYQDALKEEFLATLQDKIDKLEEEKETETTGIDAEIKKIEEERDESNSYLQAIVDMLGTLLAESYGIDPELVKRLLKSEDAKAELEKINKERAEAGEEAINWADLHLTIADSKEKIDKESTQEEKEDVIVEAVQNAPIAEPKASSITMGQMERMTFGPDSNKKDNDVGQDNSNKINNETNIDFDPLLTKLLQTPVPVTITDNVVKSVSGKGIENQAQIEQSNNSNSANTITFTGDIVINNPVGNSNDLAKELMMNLPNAFQKQIYTNLK